MKEVTDLREARGRQNRYQVLLNGDVVATLSVREISEMGLRVGAAVGGALESRIIVAGNNLAAYDRAMAMLAHGARSMFDLRRRLRAKGHEAGAVRWALARLEADGVAGDESFARQFSRSRLARGASRSAVLTGLLRAAVDRDLAERVIKQVIAEEGWSEAAASGKTAEKKIRSLSGTDRVVARRRLTAFLRRRGFGAGAVRQALDKLNEEREGN